VRTHFFTFLLFFSGTQLGRLSATPLFPLQALFLPLQEAGQFFFSRPKQEERAAGRRKRNFDTLMILSSPQSSMSFFVV